MEKIQRGNKLKKLLTDENAILLKIYCVTQTNTSEKRKIVTTLGYNKHQNDLDWKKKILGRTEIQQSYERWSGETRKSISQKFKKI